MRKLFKGGNYSREENIWGNTVCVKDEKAFAHFLRKVNYLKVEGRKFDSNHIGKWECVGNKVVYSILDLFYTYTYIKTFFMFSDIL